MSGLAVLSEPAVIAGLDEATIYGLTKADWVVSAGLAGFDRLAEPAALTEP